jgi:hypothetical protein
LILKELRFTDIAAHKQMILGRDLGGQAGFNVIELTIKPNPSGSEGHGVLIQ